MIYSLGEWVEKHLDYVIERFNDYLDYYYVEEIALQGIRKSYENNWTFEECKKYY